MKATVRRIVALCLGLALWALPSSALDVKQGQTAVKIPIYLVSSVDHTTPLTGLGSSVTVTVSKNCGAYAASAGTVTEAGNGLYGYACTTGESGTLGLLAVHATGTGADPSDTFASVVAYDPTDSAALGLSAVPIAMATTVPSVPTTGTVGAAMSWASGKIGRLGTAQGGTASTITLDAGASAVDNAYADHSIRLTGGTGSGQFATIASYVGATKIATVIRPSAGGTWSTNPDNTSTFLIEPVPMTAPIVAAPTASQIGIATRDTDNTSPAGGSIGAKINSAASSGDPWSTIIPGSYAGGTAGNILGSRLDVNVSSRSTYAGTDTAGTSTLLSRITAAPPTAGQIAGAILVTPSNLLATDSSGHVSTASLITRGTAVAGSSTTTIVMAGLPAGADYRGQRLYRLSTGESKAIQGQAYSAPNYTFTLGSTPGTSGPFGSSPSAGETILIPN